MREIKFMAWHKEKKILREVFEISFSGGYVILAGFGSFGEIEAPIRDVELMQYAGLKDKNGIEIYEGDVVSFKSAHSDYDYKTIGEVVWYRGEAAFLVECDGEIFKHFDEIREIEVLGNIYKTPELLQ
nr:MAG TPA: YopX protein [Caudoviricetes sp.]